MILQSCVFEIKSWMAYNKLKFNDDKSEFLVVCALWSRDEIHFETLTAGTPLVGMARARVSAHNLGVHIDHALIIVPPSPPCQLMMAHLKTVKSLFWLVSLTHLLLNCSSKYSSTYTYMHLQV